MESLVEIDPRKVAEVVRHFRHKKTTPLRPMFLRFLQNPLRDFAVNVQGLVFQASSPPAKFHPNPSKFPRFISENDLPDCYSIRRSSRRSDRNKGLALVQLLILTCHLIHRVQPVCCLHAVEESVRQRDALISEIQLLKQAAEKQRDELTAAHQLELEQLETELNARNEDALHRCEFSRCIV